MVNAWKSPANKVTMATMGMKNWSPQVENMMPKNGIE